MTTKQILDSIYIIPVIVDHLDKPTTVTTSVLKEHGINPEDYRPIRHLLEYHKNIVQSNFQPDYALLRIGLQEFFDWHLCGMFQALEIVDKPWMVLDYGAGEGQLARQFRIDNPDSKVVTVDRENCDINVDFEQNPDWYSGYERYFDCVILSEVLHCKTFAGQEYLINSSNEMLEENGNLIIVENIDYCMQYRINKIKGTDVKVLTPADIEYLTRGRFQLQKKIQIQNHIIYHYVKLR